MKKIVGITIISIAILIISIMLFPNIFKFSTLSLVSQKRYLRSDNKLLTTQTTTETKASSDFSNVYFYLGVRIYKGTTRISDFIYLTGRLAYTGGDTLFLQKSVYIPAMEISMKDYVQVEIAYKIDATGSINSLAFFSTEVLNATQVGGSTWTFCFHYNRISDPPFTLFIQYGIYSYIDGFSYGIPLPTADFTWSPNPPVAQLATTLDASTSTGAITSYTWVIQGVEYSSTSPTFNYVFPTAGDYSVTLTVTDCIGQTDSVVKKIQVIKALSVDFSYTGKLYTYEYLTFQANVTAIYGVQKYIWDFGDGNIIETKIDSTKHFYKNSGEFKVTLTAIDINGIEDKTSKILSIRECIYEITASTYKVLKGTDTQIRLNISKNKEPYAYANILLQSKDFSSLAQTNNQGEALFTVAFAERGSYNVSVIDSDFNNTIGNFNIYSTVKPLLDIQCEKQQFYNIIGQNDFYLTALLFDPDTYSPITDYEPSILLKSEEGIEIPIEIYREDNRFVVTAKVFSIFNDTKERTINASIEITSNSYYNTTFNTAVKMLAPIVDYWICNLEGNPLPSNLRKGTEGFTIKLIKPEYMNITEDNVYLEIRSPIGIITSNNLTLNISDDYIYVDYTFTEEGVYEIIVSIINLPIFVPTRTYIYVVQELAILDYVSKYLQHIFIVAVIIIVAYLLKKKR